MTKSLKFDNLYQEQILAGKKQNTWRPFDDKDLSENDQLDLLNKSGEKFAGATITKVTEKLFGEITDQDIKEHGEDYKDIEDICTKFTNTYNQHITPSTRLKIIWFKLN
jgi:hypothetical protein